MSIEQIPYHPVPEPPHDAVSLGRTEKPAEHKNLEFDRSEVSDFGRMLQQSSAKFRTGGKPDAERVRQLKQQLDEPVDWSDEVVDRMLARMLNG